LWGAGIVELTLERPEVKNAINWELMRRLRGAIGEIEADATAKVVLVASSVPGIFCAGADLKVYFYSAWLVKRTFQTGSQDYGTCFSMIHDRTAEVHVPIPDDKV
jgi:enoyl-CoA hydratase/carnithine racemase